MSFSSSSVTFCNASIACPELAPGPALAVTAAAAIHVVAHHHHRAGRFLDPDQRRQRRHAALVVGHLQLLELANLRAETGLGLDVDLPGAAELVEIVDVIGCQHGLQGGATSGPSTRPWSWPARGRCPGPTKECWPGSWCRRAPAPACRRRAGPPCRSPPEGRQAPGRHGLPHDLETARRAQAVHRRRAGRRRRCRP